MTPHSLAALSLRVTAIGYVLVLILLPLIGIAQQSLSGGIGRFVADIGTPQASAALWLTIEAALLTTLINALFGTLSAIVLVRY